VRPELGSLLQSDNGSLSELVLAVGHCRHGVRLPALGASGRLLTDNASASRQPRWNGATHVGWSAPSPSALHDGANELRARDTAGSLRLTQPHSATKRDTATRASRRPPPDLLGGDRENAPVAVEEHLGDGQVEAGADLLAEASFAPVRDIGRMHEPSADALDERRPMSLRRPGSLYR
jgi:hypothetical protein